MEEMRSLCHICGGIAHRVCKLCGRAACEKHIDKNGVCSAHNVHRHRTGA